MLMAAGMDAQDLENKLVADVREAKKALLDEEDPAKKLELRMMWKQAKEVLDSFRGQQVAGGEDLSGAARIDLHGVQQRVGGAVQVHATGAGGGIQAWAFRDICTCSSHQSLSGLSSQVRSCSTCGAHRIPSMLCHLAKACFFMMAETSVRGHIWAWP